MCHQTELRRYFSLSFTQVWCLSSECQCVPCVPTAFQIKHDKFTDTHTEAGVQCFPSYLEDLLLQAVDSQRSFGEIQTHAVVPNTVNHV